MVGKLGKSALIFHAKCMGQGRGGYLELADAAGDAGDGTPDFKLDYSTWRLLSKRLLELIEVSFQDDVCKGS